MSIPLTEIVSNYKRQTPDPSFVSTFFQEHPIYWLLIKIAHLGRPELLSVMALQLGVKDESLRMAIQATKIANTSFPISMGKQLRTRLDTVQIDPNLVTNLRQAILEVSPDHMPPHIVQWKKGERREGIGTEYFFHIFSSDTEVVPAKELLPIFEATEGLDDARIVDVDDLSLIQIITPRLQIMLLPIRGNQNVGYYADGRHVLDIRDQANRFVSAAYDISKTLPIVTSIGFTKHARISCFDPPKVLLVDLWALLKLMGRLQIAANRTASHRALTHMRNIIYNGNGPGFFYSDGFVTTVISDYLDKHYPVS